MNNKIGIIGFGAVGTVLATIFNKAGVDFVVYDVLMENEAHKESLFNRAKQYNAPVTDLASLIQQSTYVICTVTTQVAEAVAKKCVPHLKDNQYYIDCNSTSPGIKINIQHIIEASKANFIEGVILNAVNPGDSSLDMLIGGEKGEEVTELFKKSNLKARYYGQEVGKASMFKMLRSIFSKGVEVLLIEMLVSAKKAGIDANLWKEITTFMDSKPFEQIGETWVKSHATAYERRYHEMEQVIESMNELGVSPILTEATVRYFKQSVDIDLRSSFSAPPKNADEAVSAIANKMP